MRQLSAHSPAFSQPVQSVNAQMVQRRNERTNLTQANRACFSLPSISEKDSLKIPQQFSLSIFLLSIISILLNTVGNNFGERSTIGRVPLHKAAPGGGAGDGR